MSRTRLRALVDVNLLESPAPDWYRFHDLLQVYATERAQAEEPEAARDEAVSRLLRWYLDTARSRGGHGVTAAVPGAARAGGVRSPAAGVRQHGRCPGLVRRRAGQHRRGDAPGGGRRPARDRLAAATDLVPAVQPAEQLGGLRDHAPRRGWRARARPATGSARPGRLTSSASRWPGCAIRRPSLTLSRRWPSGRSSATRGERPRPRSRSARGTSTMHGPGEDALRYLRRAADLLEPMGAISLRSVALNNLGEVYFGLGDLDAAAECYVQARDICREIGGHAEGHALHNLGRVYLRQHRLDEAIASFEEALSQAPGVRRPGAARPRRSSSLGAGAGRDRQRGRGASVAGRGTAGSSSRSATRRRRRRRPRCSRRCRPGTASGSVGSAANFATHCGH